MILIRTLLTPWGGPSRSGWVVGKKSATLNPKHQRSSPMLNNVFLPWPIAFFSKKLANKYLVKAHLLVPVMLVFIGTQSG